MLSTVERFLVLLKQATSSNSLIGNALRFIPSTLVIMNDDDLEWDDSGKTEISATSDKEYYDELSEFINFVHDQSDIVSITVGVEDTTAEIINISSDSIIDGDYLFVTDEIALKKGDNVYTLLEYGLDDGVLRIVACKSNPENPVLRQMPNALLKLQESFDLNEVVALTSNFFTTYHSNIDGTISDFVSMIRTHINGLSGAALELMKKITMVISNNPQTVLDIIISFYKSLTTATADNNDITFSANWSVTQTSITGIVTKTLGTVLDIVGKILMIFGKLVLRAAGVVISVIGAVITNATKLISDTTHWNIDESASFLDYCNYLCVYDLYSTGSILTSGTVTSFSTYTENSVTNLSAQECLGINTVIKRIVDISKPGLYRVNVGCLAYTIAVSQIVDENNVARTHVSMAISPQVKSDVYADVLGCISDVSSYVAGDDTDGMYISCKVSKPTFEAALSSDNSGTIEYSQQSLIDLGKTTNRDNIIISCLMSAFIQTEILGQSNDSRTVSFNCSFPTVFNTQYTGFKGFLQHCFRYLYLKGYYHSDAQHLKVITTEFETYLLNDPQIAADCLNLFRSRKNDSNTSETVNTDVSSADALAYFSGYLASYALRLLQTFSVKMSQPDDTGFWSESYTNYTIMQCNQYPARYAVPPSVSRSALIGALLIDAVCLTGVALVVAAASVGLTLARNRVAAITTARAENAWSNLSSNPTEENYLAYRKAVRNNNLLSFFSGSSKISKSSYWASSSNGSESGITSALNQLCGVSDYTFLGDSNLNSFKGFDSSSLDVSGELIYSLISGKSLG